MPYENCTSCNCSAYVGNRGEDCTACKHPATVHVYKRIPASSLQWPAGEYGALVEDEDYPPSAPVDTQRSAPVAQPQIAASIAARNADSVPLFASADQYTPTEPTAVPPKPTIGEYGTVIPTVSAVSAPATVAAAPPSGQQQQLGEYGAPTTNPSTTNPPTTVAPVQTAQLGDYGTPLVATSTAAPSNVPQQYSQMPSYGVFVHICMLT